VIKLRTVFVKWRRTGRFTVGEATVNRTDMTVLDSRFTVFIHLSLFWDGDCAVQKGFLLNFMVAYYVVSLHVF